MNANGLRPYPAYRHSGVEWLGKVPAHWQVRRLKGLAKILNGATPASGRREYWGGDILWLTPEDLGRLRGRDIRRSRRSITRVGYESCGTTLAPVGSTVMSTRAPIGHLAILGREGCVNQGCRLLVPENDAVVPEWAYLGLLTARSELQALGQGTTFAELSRDALGAFALSLPPLSEQRAIARYLDHADRRIRRYIRAKERLVELLEERKRALIHEAVTGRIDVRTGQPYPAYKDSGVEWLGKVPEHWEVRRIKSLSMVKRGASPRPIADAKYFDDEGEYAWVRIADVTASDRYLEKTTQRLSPLGQSLSVELLPGSLFLSIAGSVGKPIITRIKCCIHDGFVYFPSFKGDAEFLYRVLSCKSLFGRLGKFGTQLNLNTDTVGGIYLGWPPEGEQTAIARYLDRASRRMQGTISATKRKIALLREYRTRLIADVVTGKVDVREAAANWLPETDPLARNHDRADTIPANSSLHSTAHEIAKEASA